MPRRPRAAYDVDRCLCGRPTSIHFEPVVTRTGRTMSKISCEELASRLGSPVPVTGRKVALGSMRQREDGFWEAQIRDYRVCGPKAGLRRLIDSIYGKA